MQDPKADRARELREAASLRKTAQECEAEGHWDLAAHYWRRALVGIYRVPGALAARDREQMAARAAECDATADRLRADRPRHAFRWLATSDFEAQADRLFGGEVARRREEDSR